jgi:putative Ig domain-containing protein
MKTVSNYFVSLLIPSLLLLQSAPIKALPSASAGIAYALPEARAGATYEYHITTEGGQPPFRWSVIEGEVPPGIELQPSGTLRGTPTVARSRAYEFTLQVSDSSEPPQTYAQKFAVVISPAPLRIVPGAGNKLTIVPTAQTNLHSSVASNGSSGAGSRAASAIGFSLDNAIISGALKGGADSVRGFITPRSEKVFVEVFSGTTSGRNSLINRTPVKSIDINTGEFTEKLSPPLKKDQRVRVVGLLIEGGQQVQLISDEVIVVAADPKPKAPAPAIKKPLLEGVRSVSGIALPDSDGTKPTKVVVEVFNGTEHALVGETDDLKKTGEFTVNFDHSLEVGQSVRAHAYVDKTKGEETSAENNPNQVEALGDWGRARANFAFGAVFSKERDDFSKSDPYLDFNLDFNWLRRNRDYKNLTYLLNTFFETRLTSIPVDPDKQDQSVKAAADATPADPSKCDASTTDGFLCSRKSVMVQIGTYLPIYWNKRLSWSHGGNRNVLFFAPIVKAGMNTLTADGEEGRNLLTFYSGGLRFGHYDVGKYTTPPSLPKEVSPRLISYMDITLGKWQNLEYLGSRRLRTEFEGRVKIPGLPLRFGFNANLGKGPDDLRFLIDTNFDVGRLFKKFTQSN